MLLPHHRQQPAVGAADRRVDRRVGVRGVAREQQPRPLTREQLLAHPLRRQQQEPGEPERLGRADRPQHRRRTAHRRERREQRPQHRATDGVPLPAQREPRVAVARVFLGQARRRRLPVGQQQRGPLPVRARRVGEHHRGVRPPQSVRLQVERLQDRRRRVERVESREQVRGEARVQRGGPDRAADPVRRLEQADVPARVGEQRGGDQPVVPAADDDGIGGEYGHGRVWPPRPPGKHQSGSSGTSIPWPWRSSTPRVTAADPNRSRTPSSAESSADSRAAVGLRLGAVRHRAPFGERQGELDARRRRRGCRPRSRSG